MSSGNIVGSFMFNIFILLAAVSIMFALRSMTRFDVSFFNEDCFNSSLIFEAKLDELIEPISWLTPIDFRDSSIYLLSALISLKSHFSILLLRVIPHSFELCGFRSEYESLSTIISSDKFDHKHDKYIEL